CRATERPSVHRFAAPDVGRRATRVVGRVGNAAHFRNPRLQRLLDTATQGAVDHAASVTAATELQHDDAVGCHFAQRNAPAVRGELRIDLALDHVAHALHDAGAFRRWRSAQRRRAYRQFATGGAAQVIDRRTVEVRRAARIDEQREAIALDFPLAAVAITRLAEFEPAVAP